MYSINRTEFGYRLFFADKIPEKEMMQWLEESERIFKEDKPEKFSVLIDMRNLKPLDVEAKEIMEKGQVLYRKKGMKRSAVILNSNIVALQFVKIGKNTQIGANERYIDANQYPDWEKRALGWLQSGEEPF